MKILTLHVNHDASASIIEDGNIIYYKMEERVGERIKHKSKVDGILEELPYMEFDLLVISSITSIEQTNLLYDFYNYFDLIKKKIRYKNCIIDLENHHLYHIYSGFYNSGFDMAICMALDGCGSSYKCEFKDIPAKFLTEIETVYIMDKLEKNLIHKHYHFYGGASNKNYSNVIDDKIKVSTEISVGWEFELFCSNNGFKWYDAGKVMGLSQYKHQKHKLTSPFNTNKFENVVDLSYDVQQKTQQRVIDLIEKSINETKINNIVISGGYGLNCVANYEYLKRFPGVNFYIDPICFDAGISIGSAYYHYIKNTGKEIKPISNVYIGHKENKYDLREFETKEVTSEQIAELICNKNIVAIFQGNSESGQRALGNRSLLYDPRDLEGQAYVNSIKGRENYRPFGATVLLEYVDDWFDMRGLVESPYMLYALNCYKEKVNQIPAVIHCDNTCRIQTLTENQNFHFYNLIYEFYKKTSIPMLLNTSFNLAGHPLVETFENAIDTLKSSKIEYLYLPEIKKLIYIKND